MAQTSGVFAVIEFMEEGSVEVVPTSCLSGTAEVGCDSSCVLDR